MPTNRTRRTRKPSPRLDEATRTYLLTGEREKGNVRLFMLANPSIAGREKLKEVWEIHKTELIREWVLAYPCSRPWCWWLFEAPEPRHKVGGKGITMHEHFPSYKHRLELGIPLDWFEFDPADPPAFESQAAYLQRLGLLTAAEISFLRYNAHFLEPIGLGDE